MSVARAAGLALVLVVIGVCGEARADVDWAAGLVTARGVGVANRAAPNPATARGPARRAAEEAARAKLAAEVPGLPLASGGTVGAAAKAPDVAARIARAIAAAQVISAEPETDGSWVVTLAVPVEAIRLAIAGPRAVAAGAGDAGPAVVIVEGATAAPAIGWTFGGVAAPAIWVAAAPGWAKGAPKVKASGAAAGAITLAKPAGTASTLFVVVGAAAP